MIRDAAIRYATIGIPVLALYSVDPDTGDCLCPAGASCASKGKHPRPDICPNGVKDATSDVSVVAGWTGPFNVGMALGEVAGGLMVLDIDDSDVAADLMHQPIDDTAISWTPRGMHIWMRSLGETKTRLLTSATTNKHVGELRGDGSYVVAPPSIGHSGHQYAWAPNTSIEHQVVATKDPYALAATILRTVGIRIKDEQATAPDIPPPLDNITPHDIPEVLAHDQRLFEFAHAVKGSISFAGERDRSRRLYHLAAALVEVASERGYPLKREQLAGILMRFDAATFGKYSDRADGGESEYWRLAVKVLPSDLPGEPSVEFKQEPDRRQLTRTVDDYLWDELEGCVYVVHGRRAQKVCNFLPELVEDVEVCYGLDTERVWRIRFSKNDGSSVEFSLGDRDSAGNTLEQALFRHCPAGYTVYPRQSGHLKAALQLFSTDVKRRRVYGSTGWVQFGRSWAYLLPGAQGGITSSGIDPSLRIEPELLGDMAAAMELLLPYGRNVRACSSGAEREQAWDAFACLCTCGPAEKVMPVVLQVLAGPLSSAISTAVPIVHVTGQTGSLKTSFCLAALGLVGTFDKAPESWTSTMTFLEALAHVGKDLTLLVDDYKRSTVEKQRSAIVRFVNNFADRVARGRANSRGGIDVRSLRRPRAMLLSNGEDVWEDEASAQARSIKVTVSRTDIDPARLSIVQEAVANGRLQLFGGTYIAWLAAHEDLIQESGFSLLRDHVMHTLIGSRPADAHPRLVASVASLVTVGQIVARFVHETFGDDAREWLASLLKECVRGLLAGASESAREVSEAAPFKQLVREIAAALISKRVSFSPARGVDIKEGRFNIPDVPGADIIGYYTQDGMVLLTREATLGWYERQLAGRRLDPGFSWTAVLREAEEAGGHRVRNMWVTLPGNNGRKQMSGVAVPLDTFASREEA